MGLLNALEQLLIPSKRPQKETIGLKEIICKPKAKDRVKSFRTAVIGCEYTNPDGSDRQDALKKLKKGQKVRLLWDAGETGQKKTIYLTSGRTRRFSMSDCFGRLNDKTAADVIRWLTQDHITTSAKVADIVGGTRKRPKLGCVLELATYRAPEKLKIQAQRTRL